jgi:hypothetical protein
MSLTKRTLGRRAQLHAALYNARRNNGAATVLATDLRSQAWGAIGFSSNPANSSTITLGGTVVTFGSTVAIGADLATTLATLLAFLKASADANISKCTYDITGSTLAIKSKAYGDATFTLAASAATRSAATLQLYKVQKRKTL